MPRLEAEVERLREALARESAARETAERKAAVEEARRVGVEDALSRAREGESSARTASERIEKVLRDAETRIASEIDARRVAETALARAEGELAEARREIEAERERDAHSGGAGEAEPAVASKPHARPARRASKTGR